MSGRFSLTGELSAVNGRLRRLTQDLSGAKCPELVESAKVLRRSIARVLSSPGQHSAPGQVPRKQRGRLARSVRIGAVDNGIRVAPMWFTAPILEGGINTALPTRPTKRGASRSRRGRFAGGRHHLAIAPRPFMARALALVKDEMIGIAVHFGEIRAEKAAS